MLYIKKDNISFWCTEIKKIHPGVTENISFILCLMRRPAFPSSEVNSTGVSL
ncbi:hypothetical protein T12_9788 [Trichinella patagoniensis]|uniref:Uncharacterized protein n=1 Tax=Trichinella patagoniensis TaxID=990121 RepID=A0A0V0YSG5_9BILA|nr:hypothetical protein T12_9788 [Trichinella patagoniensis]